MKKNTRNIVNKISFFILLLSLKFIFTGIMSFLSHRIDDDSDISHKLPLQDYHIAIALILTLLFAFWEEIIFRLPLGKNKIGIYLSIFAVSVWACIKFANLWSILFVILIGSLFYIFRKQITSKIINSNTIWLVIIYSFFFAILHLSNYPQLTLESKNLISVSLFIFEKFIAGLIFSYAFLKQGLVSSTLIHFIGNLIPILLMIYL